MAARNPVVGTGRGDVDGHVPALCIGGIHRLAHNSYLQMADECGVPGLLLLLLTLGAAMRWSAKSDPLPNPSPVGTREGQKKTAIRRGKEKKALIPPPFRRGRAGEEASCPTPSCGAAF